ncbi:MAG: hypothetical protein KDA75_11895 [Planctomycetaceae bacterium]|nr:hypothetical protein [Planctomycetaceae bacterium]
MTASRLSSTLLPVPAFDSNVPADSSRRHERTSVAALTDRRIRELSRDELIAVVMASRHPWSTGDLSPRLTYADDVTLRRLAFLSRQCCSV